jgi:hypothetical protein
VSDADSVWTALPAMGQYVVQPTKAVRASGDSVLFRQMDPAHDMPALLAAATAVRGLGPDTVRTANGAVACQRIALTVPRPAGAPDNITMHPRVLWIDPTTSLVLLDSMRVEQQNPQAGLVHVVTMIRQVVATADPSFEASAFRFSEGTGLRRVKRFLPPSEKHADMEGQPAPDFTLENARGRQARQVVRPQGPRRRARLLGDLVRTVPPLAADRRQGRARPRREGPDPCTPSTRPRPRRR